MKIRTASEFPDGRKYEFLFTDEIEESSIKIEGVRAICFFNGKLVIVTTNKENWDHPGGRVEDNEDYIEGCKREIIEESNMEVVEYKTLGYQEVKNISTGRNYWLAFVSCIVKPIGDFVSDPDNDIIEIKLIDPADHEKYLKYSDLGEYLVSKSKEILKI